MRDNYDNYIRVFFLTLKCIVSVIANLTHGPSYKGTNLSFLLVALDLACFILKVIQDGRKMVNLFLELFILRCDDQHPALTLLCVCFGCIPFDLGIKTICL